MTETKLVRIAAFRPLNVKNLKEYQAFVERKKELNPLCDILSVGSLNALFKGKRNQMLTRFLEWWDGRKISIEERNILRRHFNEWQRALRDFLETLPSQHIELDAGVLSRREASELNIAAEKRLSDFAEKYLFCEPEEILRYAI